MFMGLIRAFMSHDACPEPSLGRCDWRTQQSTHGLAQHAAHRVAAQHTRGVTVLTGKKGLVEPTYWKSIVWMQRTGARMPAAAACTPTPTSATHMGTKQIQELERKQKESGAKMSVLGRRPACTC